MVVASPNPIILNEKKINNVSIDVPMVDLSGERSLVSKQIVKACEEFGFFKIINHGVSQHTIAKMQELGLSFFAKPLSQKRQLLATPPPPSSSSSSNCPSSPFGYGCKNIGLNGDMGEVEYLLIDPSPSSISQFSLNNNIDDTNDDPSNLFRYVYMSSLA